MGFVAHLATYTAGHYKDAISLSIESGPDPLPPRILFPPSPTCGIIPPHRGSTSSDSGKWGGFSE
jgi:hypothetical protein